MNQDFHYYPAVFQYRSDQKILVRFPDFSCTASGTNDADALKHAKELLEITLAGFYVQKRALPASTPLQSIRTAENENTVLVGADQEKIKEMMTGEAALQIPKYYLTRAAYEGMDKEALTEIAVHAIAQALDKKAPKERHEAFQEGITEEMKAFESLLSGLDPMLGNIVDAKGIEKLVEDVVTFIKKGK